ncbi:beta-lactamase-like protein [Lineolata rhizophorae]|uniref:Beta-lactamase-like protein n=1 Tax=Lineolata rhizophorae TaxID=578093 RepID=A0A6A6NY05_9PEZI|nr:beta-lactamase-like protein [Lineolata rhizophorae]
MVQAEDLIICATCGTQFDLKITEPPKSCRICDDPRQFVPPEGQSWTSIPKIRETAKNSFVQDKVDKRVTFIFSEPKTGIGQRAILLETPHGNVLWDCITLLDDPTIDLIISKGGLKAIVISHPHFYSAHRDWAKTFQCPVYVASDDAEWLNVADDPDAPFRKMIETPTETIVPGVTAIKAGGHFPGSMMLHWDKKLLIADTLMTVPSALYHVDRLPGTTSYAFMWSIPNMIPLPPQDIQKIWNAVKPWDFETTHGGFMGQDVRDPQLKKRVLESMKIQIKSEGHVEHEMLDETV